MRRISLRVVCRLSGMRKLLNARTHCPYCDSQAVSDLAHLLRLRAADVFQCRPCLEMWHVPKGQNGPPSRDLLRLKRLEGD
jgi:formate dehydrogenase maturation protein FdhE